MDSNTILSKVINSTEIIFSSIANNYPLLLNELEKGIETATESIQSFSVLEDADSSGGEVKLSDFLERSRIESKEKLEQLNDFKEQNRIVLDKLSSAMKGYRSSQRYIEEIRDISESLQIVSLNAMCNAVKAGKGGEGFSVITGNLKNVTESTIENAGILESQGAKVSASLDEFFDLEKETGERRTALLTMLEQKVLSGIGIFQDESKTINTLFKRLTVESDAIRQSILRIMEELQQQDLIRQTIDQVVLSLSELPEKCDENNIDTAVFCLRLLDLSVVMIEEVENKINNTIEIFTKNFTTARSKLEYIQNGKERAILNFRENLESFNQLAGMGSEIKREAGQLSRSRHSLTKLIESIIGHVEGFRGEFSALDKISGWLQNVAVLSRIELSRSLKLAGMKESVDDMSVLVERIQRQISSGEKETLSFIDNITGISDEYKDYAGEEMSFLTEFTELFMNNLSTISKINNNASDSLAGFDFFSSEFCELFDVSEKELDQLKEILEDLIIVRKDLQTKDQRIQASLAEKLNGIDQADWAIADVEMNKIIEKFTIFSHKKTAGEASGLAVEDAVLEEGEITLF